MAVPTARAGCFLSKAEDVHAAWILANCSKAESAQCQPASGKSVFGECSFPFRIPSLPVPLNSATNEPARVSSKG